MESDDLTLSHSVGHDDTGLTIEKSCYFDCNQGLRKAERLKCGGAPYGQLFDSCS